MANDKTPLALIFDLITRNKKRIAGIKRKLNFNLKMTVKSSSRPSGY